MADGLDVRLGEQADELYALPPEDFVAARDAKAKGLRADGQRDLGAGLSRTTNHSDQSRGASGSGTDACGSGRGTKAPGPQLLSTR